MRKIVFAMLALSFPMLADSNSFAQAQPAGPAQASTTQNRVGVVTAVDKATSQVTIKTDTGESITIVTNDKSSVLRLPPGETSAQKATKITLADIAVGDRLFAKVATAADGKTIEARQVVVTGSAVAAAVQPDPQRQTEVRQRPLVGRITALDPAKKEVVVQSRTRDGMVPITVAFSESARFFRYAADSLNTKDASRGSFSDFKIGDQVRALGDRNADGTRFNAEEVIAGSITRTGGQVAAVNPAKNEITIKDGQGKNITVVVGQRSSLRRVTPEMAASFEARPQRQGAGASGTGAPDAGTSGNRPARQGQNAEGRPRERREGAPAAGGEERRGRGGGGGGRGLQEMLENLPAITIADLKKGDTVFVTGSEAADPSRMTAVTLITGDATFMSRFLQNGPNRGPQSPGLPGDVVGGGVGPAERPTSP